MRQQSTRGVHMLPTISGLRPEMAIVRHPDMARAKSNPANGVLTKWKKVGVAAAIGITFGIAASALKPTAWSPAPKASQIVVTRSPYIIPAEAANGAASAGSSVESGAAAVLDTEEMERLKTRNRRLEALISVLRDRKQHSAN